MSTTTAVTQVHASKEFLHHMRNIPLLSVLAQMNDSAIDLMISGDYEDANAILVDALRFIELKRNHPTQLIDHLTNPIQFSDMSNCPFNPPVNASTLYGSMCTQTTAGAVLSHVLTTGTRRPGVDYIPRSDSFHSFSRNGFRNGNAYSSSSSVWRQRLTVGIPEPEILMHQQSAIYCRAFVLHRDTCSLRIAAAILAYNAGLCAHLHAIVKDTSAVAPHRALSLYSSAYRTLWAEQQEHVLDWLLFRARAPSTTSLGESEQARTTMLLQAAVFHNLAAVHGDLFWNFAHARLFRCQLATIIRWTAFSQMETEDCTSDSYWHCLFVLPCGMMLRNLLTRLIS